MYFKDRKEAGSRLLHKLSAYRLDNCAIVALSPGAVIVGTQIATALHSNLMLLLSEEIKVPGETDAVAAVTSDNTMTYNTMYSIGEIEEFNLEYYSYIEQERMTQLHNLHLLAGRHGEIKKDRLRHHTIILLSDGLNNGFSINIATNFIKTISYKKLIIAASFATPNAYDRMRSSSDEAICLNLVDNYMGVNHYYEDNKIPEVDELLALSENISLQWMEEKAENNV